jgi:hypothetical protein
VNYLKYLVEDFVVDPCFKKWVLKHQSAQTTFWILWIKRYPEKYEEIREARKIVMILNNQYPTDFQEEINSKTLEVCN